MTAGLAPNPMPADPTPTVRPSRRSAAWFRVGAGHFFLSAGFSGEPGAAIMGAMQSVVVALRWEPIDGQLLALDHATPKEAEQGCRIGRIPTLNRGSRETWRLGLAPEVGAWLDETPEGRLYLLELCSGFDGGTARQEALEAYKGDGGAAVYAGEGGFYWFKSYHLARAEAVLSPEAAPAGAGWRSEGGAYAPAEGVRSGTWRRRAGRGIPDFARENQRPADSFDPNASYRVEGANFERFGMADPAGRPLAGLPLAAFQPFLARLAPLEPPAPERDRQPADPSLAAGKSEAARLAAWYRQSTLSPLLTWCYSAALVHLAGMPVPMEFAASRPT